MNRSWLFRSRPRSKAWAYALMAFCAFHLLWVLKLANWRLLDAPSLLPLGLAFSDAAIFSAAASGLFDRRLSRMVFVTVCFVFAIGSYLLAVDAAHLARK